MGPFICTHFHKILLLRRVVPAFLCLPSSALTFTKFDVDAGDARIFLHCLSPSSDVEAIDASFLLHSSSHLMLPNLFLLRLQVSFSEEQAKKFGEFVVSTRVRAARNISGFSLPPGVRVLLPSCRVKMLLAVLRLQEIRRA